MKNVTHVDFPEILNLGDYSITSKACMYELYSVITHHGTSMASGHYKTQCQDTTNPGIWHEFDDDKSYGCDLSKREAYIFSTRR